MTPSHVSLATGSLEGEGPESDEEGPHSEDGDIQTDDTGFYGDLVFCIPLESVGLGGNQITCIGATALADGLKSNTRTFTLRGVGQWAEQGSIIYYHCDKLDRHNVNVWVRAS